MRLAVAATPDVALPTLDWLLKSEHEIVLIVTKPDRRSGRGQKESASIVGQWGDSHQVPVIKPESVNELSGLIDKLDLVLTIGYGVLVPAKILALPKFGFLNLHFSLLPKYRGAAPVQRALENGERQTGVTVFKLDQGMDTGPIYIQKSLAVDHTWRSVELLEQLSVLGVTAVQEALALMAAGVPPTAQIGESSTASKISKADAQLDFKMSADQVVRTVKAFTYQPGAWTIWRGEPFQISQVVVVENRAGIPGQISSDGTAVFVSCADSSAIQIIEVTPAGKKAMKAIDWARGARLISGEFFG